MELAGGKLLWQLGCFADADKIGKRIALVLGAARPAGELLNLTCPTLVLVGHTIFKFSADVLPLLGTSSYSTVCPSLRVLNPAFSTAEM
jgi:hypothetical protein